MKEIAKVFRWVLLAAIIVVVWLETADYMANWAMGLILVPLIFAFLYFWQAASKTSGNDD